MSDNREILLQKKQLLQSLVKKGINNKAVLNAIYNVNREAFISDDIKEHAYIDKALPIDCLQTISQPFTVAYMTQLLELTPGDKVLEIGTGSGYQTAILAFLSGEVYTVERIPELYYQAQKRLSTISSKIRFKLADGTTGWQEHAPYEKIIVTAAGPKIPKALIEQLAGNSRLIMPVGDRESQNMILAGKNDGIYFQKTLDSFKFVPLIGKYGWED